MVEVLPTASATNTGLAREEGGGRGEREEGGGRREEGGGRREEGGGRRGEGGGRREEGGGKKRSGREGSGKYLLSYLSPMNQSVDSVVHSLP